MYEFWVALICTMCFTRTAYSQQVSASSVTGVQVKVVSDTPLQEEPTLARYQITNESLLEITALHFTYGCGPHKLTYTMDTLVAYGNVKPIKPGGTMLTRFSSGDLLACPGGVDAVVFSNGHAFGDAKAINSIYAWRRGAWAGLIELLPLLSRVVDNEGEQAKVLTMISDLKVARLGEGDRRAEEVFGENFVLTIFANSLVNGTSFIVPSDSTKLAGPDVPHVVATEKMSRTRASASVLRRELMEWKRDLEGNMQPR